MRGYYLSMVVAPFFRRTFLRGWFFLPWSGAGSFLLVFLGTGWRGRRRLRSLPSRRRRGGRLLRQQGSRALALLGIGTFARISGGRWLPLWTITAAAATLVGRGSAGCGFVARRGGGSFGGRLSLKKKEDKDLLKLSINCNNNNNKLKQKAQKAREVVFLSKKENKFFKR